MAKNEAAGFQQLQELPNTYGKTKFQLKRISYLKEDSADSS
jgi:hypothetical protein